MGLPKNGYVSSLVLLVVFASLIPLLSQALEGAETTTQQLTLTSSQFPPAEEDAHTITRQLDTLNIRTVEETSSPIKGDTSDDDGSTLEKCDCIPDDDESWTKNETVGRINVRVDNTNVSDCCCSFTDLDVTNTRIVQPLLSRVVSTPFFGHFKVDLYSSCDLWDDNPICVLRDCGVCECDAPPEWASAAVVVTDNNAVVTYYHDDDTDCESADSFHVNDHVNTTVLTAIAADWPPFAPTTLDIDEQAVVVDLRLNPERYTGYSGPSADKVWSAIHSTNCFQPDPGQHKSEKGEDKEVGWGYNKDGGKSLEGESSEKQEAQSSCLLPLEQRVYNRVVSGLHSSISLHIAQSYCTKLNPNAIGECMEWGSRVDIANERVMNHPDRLENLYVAFAVMLRAVVKAGRAVTAAVPMDDPTYSDSLREWDVTLLPEIEKMASACPQTFDETRLFAGLDNNRDSMMFELQGRFGHLQQIMRCVGCDRCKLWGTLQALGISTAFRILFPPNPQEAVALSRQEAVALVHTLERFSSSLAYAHELSSV